MPLPTVGHHQNRHHPQSLLIYRVFQTETRFSPEDTISPAPFSFPPLVCDQTGGDLGALFHPLTTSNPSAFRLPTISSLNSLPSLHRPFLFWACTGEWVTVFQCFEDFSFWHCVIYCKATCIIILVSSTSTQMRISKPCFPHFFKLFFTQFRSSLLEAPMP